MRTVLWTMVAILTLSISMPAYAQNAEKKTTAKKAESTPAVINLTQAEFLKKVADYKKNPNEWVYLGSVPAIVDFYADWCGPCKQIAPVLEQLAKDYKGKIVIYKVNTDKEQELARVFGIRSIPSLLFVPKDGKPQMAMGALPREELKKMIDTFLLGKKK